MEHAIYQVDAFTDKLFGGNPAAVCPLQSWLDDDTLQAIAAENNLAETAFFVPVDNGYHLRWFTPAVEIELCGHATLASAFVLFNRLGYAGDAITFHTLSGPLIARRAGEQIALDFPAIPAQEEKISAPLARALEAMPIAQLKAGNFTLVVVESATEVAALKPDFNEILNTGHGKVIVSARDTEYDFVSRFFGPAVGINEDPVTGSAHCVLTPYWAAKLGKSQLRAKQLSKRGGALDCTLSGDRVALAGAAKLYLQGTIFLAG